MKNIVLSFVSILLWSMVSLGQTEFLDYGDAPEGVVAYPSSGVIGAFPTCENVSLGSFVKHNTVGAYFTSFDSEAEGNGGLCSSFAHYDSDECFSDGDAGLLIPEPYTIFGNTIFPCIQPGGSSLGLPCQSLSWGVNIDTKVSNFMPGRAVAYVNVVIDWNQNGAWGDIVNCPEVDVPEHVLVNFPVPGDFTGPLSLLSPPSFNSGDLPGYVWARLMISEQMVSLNWDGSGVFEDGESEDYLFYMGEYDFGDAPEGSLAYPALGVTGAFPTCMTVGQNTFIKHIPGNSYFGQMADGESDGNSGACPAFNPDQYDQDECFQDGDAGLIVPSSFTITGPAGNEVITPCTPPGTVLDTTCMLGFWGTDIDIMVTGPGYVNVLMDWNQDGHWALDPNTICPIGGQIPEHVLVDFPVGNVTNVPLSSLGPSPFRLGSYGGYIWARFTISDQPVGNDDWDGSGSFLDGETEDYLLEVYGSGVGIREKSPGEGYVPLKVMPNPSDGRFDLDFTLMQAHQVTIEMISAQGKIISTLYDGQLERGNHLMEFNTGKGIIPGISGGIYFIRLTVDHGVSSHTKIVIR